MYERRCTTLIGLFAAVAFCLTSSREGSAQTRDEGPWWPNSQWGAQDQRGASNWITPEKILQALRSVKTGEVYELGHVYERGMPLFGDRDFKLTIPAPSPGAIGENASVWHGDFFIGEIGQVGTQFDALAHVGTRVKLEDGSVEDVFYNGFTRDQILRGNGLRALGVEKAGPIITRGFLLDIAGYKNVPTLSSRHEVTIEDVQGALARQGVEESEIEAGDAILFNYGWAVNWDNPPKYNNADYDDPENEGSPGIGIAVARWLAEREVSLVGADTCCVEVIPNPDKSLFHPVHQELITLHGIYLLENLDLRSLAADKAYRFLFIFNPLRLKGATGSPGRPLAIR
jgi:kynurenine formamidase